jgi:hypothetical protein
MPWIPRARVRGKRCDASATRRPRRRRSRSGISGDAWSGVSDGVLTWPPAATDIPVSDLRPRTAGKHQDWLGKRRRSNSNARRSGAAPSASCRRVRARRTPRHELLLLIGLRVRTGPCNVLLRLGQRLCESEKDTRCERSGPAYAGSAVDQDSRASLQLRRNLQGERPERLAIVRDPEIRNREGLHGTRRRLRIECRRIRRRLGTDFIGRGETNDGLDAANANFLPCLIQWFTAPGHAVKPETAAHVAG